VIATAAAPAPASTLRREKSCALVPILDRP
jgi:hypothetical protein